MGEKSKSLNGKCVSNSINRNISDSKTLKSENIEDTVIVVDSILNILPVSVIATDNFTNQMVTITFSEIKESASGSFGTVYDGVIDNGVRVALKKVLQDKKYKNRELEIMRILNHNHITNLLYFFYTVSSDNNLTYLNLMMEFVPQTISRILKFYFKSKSFMPMKYVKLYCYQLLRGINYMHQMGICHRDIKPQNILINPSQTLLRICDFGSAKLLKSSETNVSYICSRYYRAPELIFGATNYTITIDIWSVGCVIAEILLNKPMFPGETSLDQLVEIIKVLGTPTTEDVNQMNANYESYNLPIVSPCIFTQLFTNSEITAEIINLIMAMFEYSPKKRISAVNALMHPFFDELRSPGYKFDSKYSCPELFDFNGIELKHLEEASINRLIPKRNLL